MASSSPLLMLKCLFFSDRLKRILQFLQGALSEKLQLFRYVGTPVFVTLDIASLGGAVKMEILDMLKNCTEKTRASRCESWVVPGRLHNLLPIYYIGFGGKVTKILLFCADCVAIYVFGWSRMLQLPSSNSLTEKLIVDGMIGPPPVPSWLGGEHLGKLRRKRSDMHGTRGYILDGDHQITRLRMYFQKQNLEYHHVS
ncbi:hypothetical protein IMY05_001G0197600 [Salix suchowensis]|nr:hypothetical protein IMY05_001G0197600 [Salix suchowensis]